LTSSQPDESAEAGATPPQTSHADPNAPVTARFVFGSGNSSSVLTQLVDAELAALLKLSVDVNHRIEQAPDVTFRAILVALVVAPGGWSDWLRAFMSRSEIAPGPILKERGVAESELESLRASPLQAPTDPSWQTSSSANALLGTAIRFRDQMKAQTLGIRHVVGALIYEPGGHTSDLNGWKIDRVAWSRALIARVSRIHPRETEAWKQIHERHLSVPVGLLDTEGFSTHIATDMPTTEDALGYLEYAYAIARFMTHPLSKAPLTVGIQAPWGGGKTSLMRMIRGFLDPKAEAQTAARPFFESTVLTLREVRQLLDEAAKPGPSPSLPSPPEADRKREPLTVWFNAWKYESTNQLWAGLADAIIEQVARRLSTAERERFWFLLF
jgi:hypothetical protein